MDVATVIAANRFGYGLRPGEKTPDKPRHALEAELDAFDPKPAAIAAQPGAEAIIAGLIAKQDAVKAAKDNPDAKVAAEKARGEYVQQHYRDAAIARVQAAVASDTPFAERLVHFWSNHFCVSCEKQEVTCQAGAFEFEAIRPNLNKHFVDMMAAVETHPAMLLYLDQAQSVGPNSLAAEVAGAHNRSLGLNENLAREAMELHTMGVRSGYTQGDVTELARALTGFSVQGQGRGLPPRLRELDSARPGQAVFREAFHEPGARTILGKKYGGAPKLQAMSVLADLSQRPETAKHIATKLATHFIADDPPPAAVARIETAFLRSGGALPAVHRALIESPEAWTAPRPKFKSPWDWHISALRAVGGAPADQRAIGALNELGQPIWRPGSPAGWADISAAWAGPDALLRRVELANRIATAAPQTLDARALGPTLLGQLSAATDRMLQSAEGPAQALALLLAAPEFLRR